MVWVVAVRVSLATAQSASSGSRYSNRYELVLDTASQFSVMLVLVAVPALRFSGAGGRQYSRFSELRSLVATSSNATGMQPVNVLPDSLSSSRLYSHPSSWGMSPVNELLLRSNVVSSNSLPRDTGMLPLRLSSDRSSSVTRLGVPEVVIPSQPVIALVAAQSNVAVPRRVSLASSNASQSCTRPRLSLGSVTAVPLAQVYAAGGWAGVKVAVEPSSGVMSP